MQVPRQLVREAFVTAGEKRFGLARLLYATLFGADWGHAILGFSYMKCVDDLVDEDSDATRALGTLRAQRRFIEDIYAGQAVPRELPVPERFGYPFFCFDRARGAPLRSTFETILDTMEIDTRRRGVFLSALDLDAHMTAVGREVFRFVLRFAAPDAAIPQAFIEHASRAYLFADALIDLRHDLRFGVVNIPIEDVERNAIQLHPADTALRRWMEARSRQVLNDFRSALMEARRLEHRSLRLLARLYLCTKRRNLLRFLVREGLQAG